MIKNLEKRKINYSAYFSKSSKPKQKVTEEDSKLEKSKNEDMEEVDSSTKKLKVYTTPQKQFDSKVRMKSANRKEVKNSRKDSNAGNDSQKPITSQEMKVNHMAIALNDKEKELEDKIAERAKKEQQLQELNLYIVKLQEKLRDKTSENHQLRDKINFLLQTQ